VADLDAQRSAANDLLRDKQVCDRAFQETGVLTDDVEEAAEILREQREIKVKEDASSSDSEVNAMFARQGLRVQRVQAMKVVWKQPARYSIWLLVLKALLSVKFCFVLAALLMVFIAPESGTSGYFVVDWLMQFFALAKVVRAWAWGAGLIIVLLLACDLMDGQQDPESPGLYFPRFHTYRFLRWYELPVELKDVRADMNAVSDAKHKDAMCAWVRYQTRLNLCFGLIPWVTGETDMLVSAELLVQLTSGPLMQRTSDSSITATKLEETSARYMFVNVDKDIAFGGQMVYKNTARLAYGYYEQSQRALRHVPFPRSPSRS